MNATATTTQDITTLDFDTIVTFPREKVRRGLQPGGSGKGVEEELTALILEGGKGTYLLKFCRDLSANLVRSSLIENDAAELHDKLCSSLVLALACSRHQAQCLVDLALELIHVKVHREYRRSNVDLGYLVASAGDAIRSRPAVV